MMNMSKKLNKNPFNKRIRGLDYYNKLQIFAEQELDDSFENLALFIRNVIIEQNDLVYDLGKYDLIVLVPVDISFPKRLSLNSNIECCIQIYNNKDSK
ncbi:hypothetical protein NIES2111_39080 [Nostoc sp. NIES-2111]|nr:hypothetical protein NIES2111_39080 [Nostoc sp. NIES-2111]